MPITSAASKHAFITIKSSSSTWHRHLGYPSSFVVQQVLRRNKIDYTPESTPYVCDSCQLAKSHQLPYPISTSRSTVPLEQVFSDVWGPAPLSVGKHEYYVSFIDDFSKFTWIYLLKKRSDVYQAFLNFQQFVERKFDRKIVTMQTNWGGEYEKLNSFFQKAGITHHVSCPHAHQQNGSAERKHHHIAEVGLALLANASMPLKYWDEAFLTATFLINLLPSKVIDLQSPAERLLNIMPNYDALHIFGCACWPNLRPYNKRKLAFRSQRCVFLGYSPMHKGVKCLDVSTGRVYISLDVVFDENVFPFQALHPNAGALLKREILLLPTHISHESASITDNHMTTIVPVTVPLYVASQDPPAAGENYAPNDAPTPTQSLSEESVDRGSGTDSGAASADSSVGTDPEEDPPASPSLGSRAVSPTPEDDTVASAQSSPTMSLPHAYGRGASPSPPRTPATAAPSAPDQATAVQLTVPTAPPPRPRTRLQQGIRQPKNTLTVLFAMACLPLQVNLGIYLQLSMILIGVMRCKKNMMHLWKIRRGLLSPPAQIKIS
jgi:hypothetical protein